MWLSNIRGSLIKASVTQWKAGKPSYEQRLIAPFQCKEMQALQKGGVVSALKGRQILLAWGECCVALLFGLAVVKPAYC